MPRKRILIDLERLRYENSGLANVFRNITKGIERTSHPFDMWYFGPKDEISKINSNNQIIPYQKWHKYFEFFSSRFDVVHVSFQLSWYFRKNYTKTLKILTIHDLNFLYENLGGSRSKRVLNRINKNLRYVDYLVCISNFVKDDILKNRNILKFEKLKDIFVIYNGIELPENNMTYPLEKYEFLKNKKYILNIGVLLDKKNQLSLIEMLPFIEEDLVLLASSEKEPYGSKVRKRIAELGVENRVHFLKNLSEEEKYAVIQNCEAMCHPSLAEGFGIPPIEAMAFGKPVFLSNLTSLPEIGGEHAFYFNSFETQEMVQTFKKGMEIYWQNPEMYGQKLKDWAKQFDYQVMAKNYLDLYAKILAEKQQT